MGRTIVIVDDFKANTVVMNSTLTNAGFEVLEANSPEEAMLLFDGRKIDLMVTDYLMPNINGAELTSEVKSRSDYKSMPVLILSAENDEKYKVKARNAGAYGWLMKPFNLERFMKVIDTVVLN